MSLLCRGYTIRTPSHRYTEWRTFDPSTFRVDWSGPAVARELYDHSVDAGEDDNLCFPQTGGAAPCVHGGGVDAGLAKRLRTGWRGELPPAAG